MHNFVEYNSLELQDKPKLFKNLVLDLPEIKTNNNIIEYLGSENSLYNGEYNHNQSNDVNIISNNLFDDLEINDSPKPKLNKINSNTPKFTKNKWSEELTKSYKRAGITNENALKYLLAQDALESAWGKSAQGKYNYGNLTSGSYWKGNIVEGNDKDASGKPIRQKFRFYNSIDEYTKDKVDFLKRLYDFDQNDDINTFTNKLKGGNKSKRHYAEAKDYKNILTKVYNSLQNGGTINMNIEKFKNGGKKDWIQDAVNPKHKGYCTPMTKSTCTPKRKVLAKTFKKMAKDRKHQNGGIIDINLQKLLEENMKLIPKNKKGNKINYLQDGKSVKSKEVRYDESNHSKLIKSYQKNKNNLSKTQMDTLQSYNRQKPQEDYTPKKKLISKKK